MAIQITITVGGIASWFSSFYSPRRHEDIKLRVLRVPFGYALDRLRG